MVSGGRGRFNRSYQRERIIQQYMQYILSSHCSVHPTWHKAPHPAAMLTLEHFSPSPLSSEFLSRFSIFCFSTTVCFPHTGASYSSDGVLSPSFSFPLLPRLGAPRGHYTGNFQKNTEQLGNASLREVLCCHQLF